MREKEVLIVIIKRFYNNLVDCYSFQKKEYKTKLITKYVTSEIKITLLLV
jgi:hypothetical protein